MTETQEKLARRVLSAKVAPSPGRAPADDLDLAQIDRLLLESASANALHWLDEIESLLAQAQQQAVLLREELLSLPPEQRRHTILLLRSRILLAPSRLSFTLGELVRIRRDEV